MHIWTGAKTTGPKASLCTALVDAKASIDWRRINRWKSYDVEDPGENPAEDVVLNEWLMDRFIHSQILSNKVSLVKHFKVRDDLASRLRRHSFNYHDMRNRVSIWPPAPSTLSWMAMSFHPLPAHLPCLQLLSRVSTLGYNHQSPRPISHRPQRSLCQMPASLFSPTRPTVLGVQMVSARYISHLYMLCLVL